MHGIVVGCKAGGLADEERNQFLVQLIIARRLTAIQTVGSAILSIDLTQALPDCQHTSTTRQNCVITITLCGSWILSLCPSQFHDAASLKLCDGKFLSPITHGNGSSAGRRMGRNRVNWI